MAAADEQDRRQRTLDSVIAGRLRRAVANRPRETLAVALGVDVTTVEAYLSGQRRIPSEHLLSLATLLNVPVSAFYGKPMDRSGERG